MEADKIQSIQLLRGVAAFMVLLSHLYCYSFFPLNLATQFFSYGRMGVHIFFIISGFIVPYSLYVYDYKISDIKQFFFKRITRIEPPYIVSILLIICLNYTNKHPDPIHLNDVLGHLLYLNVFTGQPWLNVVYWTLAIEFEFYVIIAFVYPLLTHSNKAILWATYLLLLGTAFIKVTGWHILLFFPFFLMGIALFLFMCKKVSLWEFFALLLAASVVCYFKHGFKYVCLAYTVMLAIYFIKKVPGIFLFFGAFSYSLYLTHKIIIFRFMGFIANHLPGWSIHARALLCMIFCFVFAYFYYVIIEKKFIRLSKRIQYHHTKETDVKPVAAT